MHAKGERDARRRDVIAKNKTYHGMTIQLDGATFIGCTFDHCVLVFSGVLGAQLHQNAFLECKFEFSGPAATTLGFMAALYKDGVQDVIEKTFDNIRNTSVHQPPVSVTLN